MAEQDLDELVALGRQLRVDSVRCSAVADSGLPTSSMSAADLMAVLLARHLRYAFDTPDNSANDHLIFSKGHASPLLYAMFKVAGAISDEELLTFRARQPVGGASDAAAAVGRRRHRIAGPGPADRRRDRDRWPPARSAAYRVWVLCGDGELAEGSMWEAFEHAGHVGLDNLTAVVDVNRLGQRGPTRHGWDTGAYAARMAAFGWHTIEIDGHDVAAIDAAYREATATSDRPTVILARTRKGDGVAAVENKEGAHGKPVPDFEQAVVELGAPRDAHVTVPRPPHPDRFFECYIAEQQMLAAAVGMQVRGWTPYAATFAAFLSRAHDFTRMAAVSRANLRVVGSHAGVAVGQDGPSQMGLEDLAAFRAVLGSTVLYPCDANQTAALVVAMADRAGISYLRTTRGATPVLYEPGKEFPIGGSRVLRSSPTDQVTIVAAGVTVHEALAAADQLAGHGVNARVIDLYSVKPIDAATLRQAAAETGRLVTVEDHWPEGGLGDAVLDVFADGQPGPRIVKLAVRAMPGSATPAEQLNAAGIDAEAITRTALALAGNGPDTAATR